ncbi:preprotein translocase subunit SecA [Candidatus Gottesmanbacteria bacterium]|nr:preprotein translocase subunit SecA [Candidatus Gottesmanbacteria bacterium]
MIPLLSKFLDSNERELSRLVPLVEKINSFEDKIQKLSDQELQARGAEFKTRLSKGETIDDLLPEVFAACREAGKRTIGERHFDVQIMAAIVLYQGKVAEQKTGEGKTLSAAPALYLNSLGGRGVHLVTVNDYLARRDCGWMGPIYHALGASCAAIIHEQSFIYDPDFEDATAQDWRLKHLRPISRKEAYQADITYGINSEFGFDYLRDNMASDLGEIVQREHHFAIVDEVDSVLIDEARTPHIISAPQEEATQKYYDYAKLVERLNPATDFTIDEKLRTAALTEHGIAKIEKMLGVPNLYEKDFATVHHLEAALKAKTLFHQDKDYVVRDNQVIIVDEFTGRLLIGRRYSEGLHQAIEAKENVPIQQESRTLATVSLQNYFRMYQKLAGMTGTAATEAEEFHKIYNLEVVIIPTNKPMIRINHPDVVYKTMRAKYAAVAREIEECFKKGQPVLVGTTSIENNEIVSDLLTHKGIPHQVLNAKQHEKEATIIAQAGKMKAITVATNMAGRGVDIILGGFPEFALWQKAHQEVVKFGGLHVIGTERHESRRVDNQLRGRSGRQGDPGSSRFFVSLEDEIMRLFGGDQVARLMTTFKMPEDVPLEHPMVSRAIEQAQIKVEGFNFDARKHLVEYDDVLNKQREIIYRTRRKVLAGEGIKEEILAKLDNEISNLVIMYFPEGYTKPELEQIIKEFATIVPFEENSQKQILAQISQFKTSQEIIEFLTKISHDLYQQREGKVGEEVARQIERWVSLSVIDTLWMDHLDAIDDLREGIGLRGYGQRDPLIEYKNEAYAMFERLLTSTDYEIVHRIFKVQVVSQPQVQPQRTVTQQPSQSQPLKKKKIGRNDPCPCGSGKKYKKCHYPEYG